MDSSDFPPPRKLPRRELQGPRPPPPGVQEDSGKIKKLPVMAGLPPPPPPPPSLPPRQPRRPVVIYSLPPRVIHTNRSNFKDLVQRLTGLLPPKDDAAASSSLPRPVNPFSHPNEAVFPAARFASMEMAAESCGSKRPRRDNGDDGDVMMLEGIDMTDNRIERTGTIPGILSPAPLSLQPIPGMLFSPAADTNLNPISFLQDSSDPTVPYSNKNPNFSDLSGLLQSATAPFVSPRLTTTTSPPMDPSNNSFDR